MLSTKPLAALAVFAFLSAATMPASAAGSNQARIDAAACDKPHFPARWQNDGDGASVVVGYLVDADGKVVDSKIVESSGFAYIDRASQRAGARCKFTPAEGSQAAAAWTKVKYSWVVN
jgi:TonB family protein